MNRDTKPYKRSLSGSVGAGVKSIVSGARKPHFILEHRIGSKYHVTGEYQEIIVDQAEIGRDRACQIRFDEVFQTVSRRHAAIIRDGNHWKLIPLSKTNPTLLNGERVQKEWFLQHGDEIQCAVNGPKLMFMIPSGKAGNLTLGRRLRLFVKQALRPCQRVVLTLTGIILLLLIVVGVYFIFIHVK